MIYVDTGRCTGCGECVDTCSAGAITLKNELAFIDESLCKECEACLGVCQPGAILLVEPVDSSEYEPIRSISAPIRLRPATLSVSLRDLLRPAFGAALLWTGRELVPCLAELALNRLSRLSQPVERPIDSSSQRSTQAVAWGMGGRGRQQGRRRRQRYQNRRR